MSTDSLGVLIRHFLIIHPRRIEGRISALIFMSGLSVSKQAVKIIHRRFSNVFPVIASRQRDLLREAKLKNFLFRNWRPKQSDPKASHRYATFIFDDQSLCSSIVSKPGQAMQTILHPSLIFNLFHFYSLNRLMPHSFGQLFAIRFTFISLFSSIV